MERVEKFLKEAETYYLATVEGNQPRVRPFGTAHIFEGKLYIQTGKVKEVSKQIHANPKVEICAFKNGEWLRVAGELVEDDRREARQSMPFTNPVSGTQMKILTRCLWSGILTRRQDAARIRII